MCSYQQTQDHLDSIIENLQNVQNRLNCFENYLKKYPYNYSKTNLRKKKEKNNKKHENCDYNLMESQKFPKYSLNYESIRHNNPQKNKNHIQKKRTDETSDVYFNPNVNYIPIEIDQFKRTKMNNSNHQFSSFDSSIQSPITNSELEHESNEIMNVEEDNNIFSTNVFSSNSCKNFQHQSPQNLPMFSESYVQSIYVPQPYPDHYNNGLNSNEEDGIDLNAFLEEWKMTKKINKKFSDV